MDNNLGSDLKEFSENQLEKSRSLPLPPSIDLSLTRMYFHSIPDIFYRLSLLCINLFFLIIVLLNATNYSVMIIENLNLDFAGLQKGVYQVLIMIIITFFSIMFLLTLLPIFLAKTVKGIKKSVIFYLFFAFFFGGLIFAANLWLFLVTKDSKQEFVLIACSVGTIFWFLILIGWFYTANIKKKVFLKSIVETYNL